MLALLLALIAQAQQEPTVDVLVRTRVPVDVGLGAVVEAGPRLQIGAGVGVLPGPYVDLINAIATGAGWYGEDSATLIRATLEQSLVLSTDVAWRPVPSAGFTFGAGYSLAALGGDTTGAELIAAASGLDPVEGTGEGLSYRSSATVHLVRPELGWQIPAGSWVVHLGIGGAFTVASSVRVEPEETPGGPLLERANQAFAAEAARWLDQTLEHYVHTPTISVGFGRRFGP